MHFRSKAHDSPRSKRHEPADRMPSTAWLAAQEAFSAPKPAQAEPAVVVVRKIRAPSMGLGADAATAAAVAQENLDRPARVFLVVPEPAEHVAAAPLQDSPPAAEPVPPAPRQRRRLHADKRPGPVLHITQPTPLQAAREVAPPPRGPSVSDQIASLQALMADVNVMFDHIQRARALHFLG